jgi:hypothetical protein
MYPHNNHDSNLAVNTSLIINNDEACAAYVPVKRGRLIISAKRKRGMIRLVKYGKGCFVRCAYG